MKLQVEELIKYFDELQSLYGDESLNAIPGAGEICNPKLFLIFINPTSKNVSAKKEWKGLRAPWLGTRNVWRFLCNVDLFNKQLFDIINSKNFKWSYEFAERVYTEVKRNSVYITNLCKLTQKDARLPPKKIIVKYLGLLKKEIEIVKPRIIISFGSLVSSLLLGKAVKISEYRRRWEVVEINGSEFKVFPVYYPVGQGMKNIKIAEEDLKWIIQNFL
jgi:DNA polymerase